MKIVYFVDFPLYSSDIFDLKHLLKCTPRNVLFVLFIAEKRESIIIKKKLIYFYKQKMLLKLSE